MSPKGRRRKAALALAGGGPLGAIYEIGVLMALSEALDGFDFNELDAYVGVSAGSFIAAGLANGLSPAYLYRMFIDSDSAEVPFEPEMLLKPAIGEYARRAARLPSLLLESSASILRSPLQRDFLASFQRLSRAIPTGVFDNAGIDDFLGRLFSLPGLSNDFRRVRKPLFLVATDLDSGNRSCSARRASSMCRSPPRSRPARPCRACTRRSRSTVAGMSMAR
jgi:NTE family protein